MNATVDTLWALAGQPRREEGGESRKKVVGIEGGLASEDRLLVALRAGMFGCTERRTRLDGLRKRDASRPATDGMGLPLLQLLVWAVAMTAADGDAATAAASA